MSKTIDGHVGVLPDGTKPVGGRYAECGDCDTCGKCDAVEMELRGFDEAVRKAAALERDSYEKNLRRERSKTLCRDMAQGDQHETFKRNAVVRPSAPAHEGAIVSSHDGLTLYTLIIYSENFAGILNQITAVFTRRQVNIESLNVCASSTPGVHKYTITCYCKQEMAEMLTKQIEKRIDVLQANCFLDDEIFILETSLMKLSSPMVLADKDISRIVRRFDARFVEVNPTYTIVEKTGITEDVMELFRQLDQIGCVLQFVRTGRIAVTKSSVERLDQYIAKREGESHSA